MKNKEKLNFVDKYIAPAFIILLIIFTIIYRTRDLKAKKECHKIATGTILRYVNDRYNEGNLIIYYVDGKKYDILTGILLVPLPKNKKVPILYACSNPDFAQALLTPNNFAEYGLEFPDSMKWILPFIEKHKEKSLIPVDP